MGAVDSYLKYIYIQYVECRYFVCHIPSRFIYYSSDVTVLFKYENVLWTFFGASCSRRIRRPTPQASLQCIGYSETRVSVYLSIG